VTTWEDISALALLGTARRDVEAAGLPAAVEQARTEVASSSGAGSSPAGALLDLAALATVYRRAGVRPSAAIPLPEPPPRDPRPVVAPIAASRLVAVLGRADAELLELWLLTAAGRGVRPPDRLLPALLDQAARQPSVAAALVRACGPQVHWLAAQRPHWARALAGDGAEDTALAPDLPPDAWTAGSPEQRRVWLRARRSADPGGARDLLEAGWEREAPGERARLLTLLELRLGSQDEPFLERCLGDRRGEVRRVAADLLSKLPGSALAARAAARALAAVRVERHLGRRRLVVEPPRERDAEMARDQVPPAPRDGAVGPGAWYLGQVVAAAPLRTWVPALAPTPADLVGLDVAGGWEAVLWEGWARATLRESNAAWAEALVTSGQAVQAGKAREVPALALRLVGLVPDPVRSQVVAQWVANGQLPAGGALSSVPAPWPDRLVQAVVERLAGGVHDHEAEQLLVVASRRLPAAWGPALAAAGARRVDPAVRRRYDEAADLVLFRHEMLEEIR
jgi:hypothetical protein